MPVPILPLYSSSKTGLSIFTKSLQIKLKPTNFKVIEIVPPAVETKMIKEDMNNITGLAKADDFALKMIKKIEADALAYAPGLNAKWLHFIRRIFTESGLKLIDKLTHK